MPLPKPKPGEEREDWLPRCVPLVIEDQDLDAESEDDRNQAVAICSELWRDRDKNMDANTKLIKAIHDRSDDSASISTADRYVRPIIDACGEGLFKSTFGYSGKSILKEAENQLVFSHPGFVTTKQSSNQSQFGELLPQFDSLPDGVKKHAALLDFHTVTTPDEDRDKDVLVSEGARIDPKLPTLWMHMQHALLGKMVAVLEQSAGGIKLVSVLLTGNELRDDAILLTEAEALRWSHGFIAEEFEERKDRGFKVKGWEMLEESKVAIPSNRRAETDQIISLFSGGKLQSDFWKAVAKSYHDERPAQMSVPTQVQMKLKLGDFEQEVTAQNREDAIEGLKAMIDMNEDAKNVDGFEVTKYTEPGGKVVETYVPVQKPTFKTFSGSKHFNPDMEHLEASKLEYDWAAKFLGCQIKELVVTGTPIRSVYAGSFFYGEQSIQQTGWQKADQRNLTYDGKEHPLRHEVIELNSERSGTFMIDGIEFWKLPNNKRLVIKHRETWFGYEEVIYSKDETGNEHMSKCWDWVRENNFLKGEAFSLTGSFIKRKGQELDDVFLEPKNKQAVSRAIRIMNDKQDKMKSRGMILSGPPGCLHADTMIFDPVDNSILSVQKRWELDRDFHVFAKTPDDEIVITKAEKPWRYEKAEMLEFTFESGRQITVTKGHRFWTYDGYVSAEQICERRQQFGDVHLPSTVVAALSIHAVNGRHLSQTIEDSQVGCPSDSCFGDEQLRLGQVSDQDALPSQAFVPRRNRDVLHEGDRDASHSNTPSKSLSRRSTSGSAPQIAARIECDEKCPTHESRVEHVDGSSVDFGQCQQSTSLLDKGECTHHVVLESKMPSFGSGWSRDRITEIRQVGKHHYFDFHVPTYENYWAAGYFHHNTGKTLSCRVLLNQCKSTFIWISAKDFWRTGAVGGICSALDLAAELAPAVVCLEDVDNWIAGHSTDLLKTEMDGLDQKDGVLTVLSTNFPEKLPDALIDRPGRFHDVLEFDLPNEKIRLQMLQAWTSGVEEKELAEIATKTQGYSGAHMFELCQFAETLKDEDEKLDMKSALDGAIEKIDEQRELITQQQLSGSNYKPGRREFEQLVKQKGSWNVPTKWLIPEVTYEKFLEDLGQPGTEQGTKAGRVLADKFLKKLKAVRDDLEEMHGMDKMPKAAGAMCERCMRNLDEVIKAAEKPMKPEENDKPKPDEEKPKSFTDKEALSQLLRSDDEQFLRKAIEAIGSIIEVNELDDLARQYRELEESFT